MWLLKILKTLAIVVLGIFVSSSAFAVAQGLYLGIATGPATNTGGNQNITYSVCTKVGGCGPCNGTNCQGVPFDGFGTVPGKPTKNQWGSRLFLGYMFNPYLGLEGGFNFFSGIHYNFTLPTATLNADGSNPIQSCGDARVRVRDIDVSLKFALPFGCFDAFARVGVALTYITSSGAMNQPQSGPVNCNPCNVNQPTGSPTTSCPCNSGPINSNFAQCGSSSYSTKYDPIFTVGISYDFTQSGVLDLSYTRLITGGAPKNMDFIALGISYHFVDIYCGQFLCD